MSRRAARDVVRLAAAAAPALALAGACLLAAAPVRAQPFTYLPPGDLVPGSGQGLADDTVYAPGMRFPIEEPPAFANSQVWGAGGLYGPGGSQCDEVNFSYPWRDNFCETRQWDMPLCPAGQGHQGQDIRAATCEKNVHWAVAAADGTITNIGSYSVYLTTEDGTRFDYLHMGSVAVKVGDEVKKGQHLGRVSNEFGGTPTTVHLHFNIRQNVAGVGTVFVPPYMSLVESYSALVGAKPEGRVEAADCAGIRGWALDADHAGEGIDVQLLFDGLPGEPLGEAIVSAGSPHEGPCGELSPCEHGFSMAPPVSLSDGHPHVVRAYAIDPDQGTTELAGSPIELVCALPLEGVRRRVDDAAAWSFSSFWDELIVDDPALEALPEGEPLPAEPVLAKVDGAPEVWLVDGGSKRLVAGPEVAEAWRLDLTTAETWSASTLDGLEEGPPLRPRPVLVRAPSSGPFLVDDPSAGSGASAAGVGGAGSAGAAPAGAGGAAANPKSEKAETGGCGCRVSGDPAAAHARWALVSTAALAAALRRRRRVASA